MLLSLTMRRTGAVRVADPGELDAKPALPVVCGKGCGNLSEQHNDNSGWRTLTLQTTVITGLAFL